MIVCWVPWCLIRTPYFYLCRLWARTPLIALSFLLVRSFLGEVWEVVARHFSGSSSSLILFLFYLRYKYFETCTFFNCMYNFSGLSKWYQILKGFIVMAYLSVCLAYSSYHFCFIFDFTYFCPRPKTNLS